MLSRSRMAALAAMLGSCPAFRELMGAGDAAEAASMVVLQLGPAPAPEQARALIRYDGAISGTRTASGLGLMAFQTRGSFNIVLGAPRNSDETLYHEEYAKFLAATDAVIEELMAAEPGVMIESFSSGQPYEGAEDDFCFYRVIKVETM
ncbi:MAG: hypothetical protein AB7F32_12925 [Victivallaceae bacterium]